MGKRIIRLLALLFALTLALGLMPTSLAGAAGTAATGSQDGLQATITTGKDACKTGDDIQIRFTVTNTNDVAVKDVALATTLPSALKLKSGELTKRAESLSPGAALSVSATATAQGAVTPGNGGQSNKNGTTSGAATSSKHTKSGLLASGDASITAVQALLLVAVGVTLLLAFRFRAKTQKGISILLCAALVIALIPARSYGATSQTPKSFNLTKTVKIDGKDYNIGATVSYTVETEEQEPTPADGTYTRGQWLQLLEDKLEITQIALDDDYDYVYGDSPDSPYGAVVETAQAYGLLSTPATMSADGQTAIVPLFNPDDSATREFVAYTVVKAMGYQGDYTLECTDKSSLLYESEDSIAIQEGFLSLTGGAFVPDAPLTTTDKNIIFARIDELNASLEVAPGEEKDEINYQPGVLQVKDLDYTVVDNGDGTYTVSLPATGTATEIKAGTVFVLPPSDEYLGGIALKATKVNTQDGSINVNCFEPNMGEALSSFDIAEEGMLDLDHMTTMDGVIAEYDPNGVVIDDDGQLSPYEINVSTPIPGKFTYHLNKAKVDDSDLTVSGTIETSIPNVTIKAKGGVSLDEFTAAIAKKTKITGQLKYDGGLPAGTYEMLGGHHVGTSNKIELPYIPISTPIPGVYCKIVPFVYIDISGTISISYTITDMTGVQYIKGRPLRILKDFQAKRNGLEINATAKLGFGLSARIAILGWTIAGIDGHAGLGITAKFIAHTDVNPPLYCGDGSIYLYATIELDEDTPLVAALKKDAHLTWSWDIYDEDNSPCKWKVHFEGNSITDIGKIVPKCTYGTGNLLGSVVDAGTNEPVDGAKVRIYNNETGMLVKTVSTNQAPNTQLVTGLDAGQFSVPDLPIGAYRLEVTATGYPLGTATVSIEKDKQATCVVDLGATQLPDDGDDGSKTVEPQVVFTSNVSDLVPNDNNGASDVFLEKAGVTTLVSKSLSGGSGNAASYQPSVSDDGKWIVFVSSASDLVADDTNNDVDIFRYNTATGALERIVTFLGKYTGSHPVQNPVLSGDGKTLVFQADPNALNASSATGAYGVFLMSLSTDGGANGAPICITNSYGGGYLSGSNFSMSADGHWAVFQSGASNLVQGDTNGCTDVFLWDTTTQMITRVSVGADGVQGNGNSYSPKISGNGRYVLFYSDASNLVSDDTNGGSTDLFRYDIETSTIELVDKLNDGNQSGGLSDQFGSNISFDGNYVVFASNSREFMQDVGLRNYGYDGWPCIRHDMGTGQNGLVSVVTNEGYTYQCPCNPVISSDGRYIAYLDFYDDSRVSVRDMDSMVSQVVTKSTYTPVWTSMTLVKISE